MIPRRAIDDRTIQAILAERSDVKVLADRLVQTALERNGSDNITALVVRSSS
jgi:serine/threonine protein phosphatase PrpC